MTEGKGEISISDKLMAKLPQCRLGILEGNYTLAETFNLLDSYKQEQKQYPGLYPDVVISQTRKAYKITGKEPSRYRPSAEALARRFNSGKDLYQVNPLVDTVNLISLKTGFSIGLFDNDLIQYPVLLDIGKGENYKTIGRGNMNIKNMPVLFDTLGPFGNPSSDSDRSKIVGSTTNVLVILYDFFSNESLYRSLQLSKHFLEKYCNFKLNCCRIC